MCAGKRCRPPLPTHTHRHNLQITSMNKSVQTYAAGHPSPPPPKTYAQAADFTCMCACRLMPQATNPIPWTAGTTRQAASAQTEDPNTSWRTMLMGCSKSARRARQAPKGGRAAQTALPLLRDACCPYSLASKGPLKKVMCMADSTTSSTSSTVHTGCYPCQSNACCREWG